MINLGPLEGWLFKESQRFKTSLAPNVCLGAQGTLSIASSQPLPWARVSSRSPLLEHPSELRSSLSIASFIERERASPGPCLLDEVAASPAEGGLSSLQVPGEYVLDGWTDGQRNEWLHGWKDGLPGAELWRSQRPGNNTLTREDEEDAGDKGQDGPVGADVSDVAQDKPDEHEEETDQRERCGRANHF